VTLHWVDLALMVTAVIAGCAATYFAVLRGVRRVFLEREARIADQLAALGDAVGALETRLEAQAIALEAQRQGARPAAVTEDKAQPDGASPRIRAAVAAAATAFFGRSVAVRSVKPASAGGAASPWSQQGRVLVQTSHNLPTRR